MIIKIQRTKLVDIFELKQNSNSRFVNKTLEIEFPIKKQFEDRTINTIEKVQLNIVSVIDNASEDFVRYVIDSKKLTDSQIKGISNLFEISNEIKASMTNANIVKVQANG